MQEFVVATWEPPSLVVVVQVRNDANAVLWTRMAVQQATNSRSISCPLYHNMCVRCGRRRGVEQHLGMVD
jgi:hypothetical protein